MAVLPTPGWPISTGLFFVRLNSTCDDTPYLFVAPYNRVELSFGRCLREIAAIFLKGRVLALRVLVSDALVST